MADEPNMNGGDYARPGVQDKIVRAVPIEIGISNLSLPPQWIFDDATEYPAPVGGPRVPTMCWILTLRCVRVRDRADISTQVRIPQEIIGKHEEPKLRQLAFELQKAILALQSYARQA